jgi:hypothetical protein
MSDNNQEQKTAKIVATTKLTEQQVQKALVNFVSQDPDLVEVLKEKQAVAWVNWHVNKWDNPETFCTLSFGVVDNPSSGLEKTAFPDAVPVEPKDES